MRLTRCFVPPPLISGERRLLPDAVAAHVAKVLRARVGQNLTLFDGCGGEYDAQVLQIERGQVRVQIDAHRAIERESPLRVTLLQALSRGERMDLVIQKATELGVNTVVPVNSERSVVRLSAETAQRRTEHWRAIAISACEQCGRNRIPSIQTTTELSSACAQADTDSLRILLAPDAGPTLSSLAREARSVTLLIGPEGGFTSQEIALAQHHGFQSCRLGPRVLRAETAPLAALAALQVIGGDLRD